MAEYWEMFFKPAAPREATSGEVKLSSTTETQAALDDAAEGRGRREPESTYTFTSVGPSLVLPDGGTEHGEIQVKSDRPPAKAKPMDGLDLVGSVSAAQGAAIEAVYESAALAAKAAYPDFEETLAQTAEQIPVAVIRFIKAALPNGPLVARYLAGHPVECERLRDMVSRGFITQAQRHCESLSDKLAVDASFGMDADDYRTFRMKRNYQIRSRI
jgi:hypothetical protein